MPIYKPLPESLILTPEQVKDFDRLQEALSRMRGWLESHNYQSTTVEPVIIGKTSWLRKKEVKSLQHQRIFPLHVAFILTGHTHYSDKFYAVNIDGDLLVGNMVSRINKTYTANVVSDGSTGRVNWASAQFTGLRPDAIYSIVKAINKVTAR